MPASHPKSGLQLVSLLAILLIISLAVLRGGHRRNNPALGDAYVQTERPDNCQWRGSAPFTCNWCLNPTPIFADQAAVTENMKDGQLVKGLHSWAGYTIGQTTPSSTWGPSKVSQRSVREELDTVSSKSTTLCRPAQPHLQECICQCRRPGPCERARLFHADSLRHQMDLITAPIPAHQGQQSFHRMGKPPKLARPVNGNQDFVYSRQPTRPTPNPAGDRHFPRTSLPTGWVTGTSISSSTGRVRTSR